jgi:N-acylneuraminate cytidylyltransferase
MIISLIPARGGSKRLPGKNIKPFAGRPLLAHSIAQSNAVPAISRCVVSSDDAEILAVARQYGAEALDRPARLADDRAATVSVLQHALTTLFPGDAIPEAVVTLQPNCPLRTPAIIEDALRLFRSRSDIDSVVSVTVSHRKHGIISSDGLFGPEYRPGERSQDLAPRYYENGVLYVSRAATVLDKGDMFGRILPVVIDPIYAMGDIDTALDFEVAEHLFLTHRAQFELSASR